MRLRSLSTILLVALLLMPASIVSGASEYCVIRVIDEDTGRGVPLVELGLPNDVRYWTDSAGVAALDEPSLVGCDVFISVHGHGYQYPNETFLGRGVNVRIEPGRIQEVRVRRTMVAERLYRLTGEGIYRDSMKAGLPVSLDGTQNGALVLGQDTACATPYRGKLFWIWGDTVGPTYWNFSVTAATSDDTRLTACLARLGAVDETPDGITLKFQGGVSIVIEDLHMPQDVKQRVAVADTGFKKGNLLFNLNDYINPVMLTP